MRILIKNPSNCGSVRSLEDVVKVCTRYDGVLVAAASSEI
jgi:hypothetical protein